MAHGKQWDLADPASIIGGQPVGKVRWQQNNQGLTLDAPAAEVYVPLNFDGLLLPADALSQLTLNYHAQQRAQIRLYHRAQLEGPAARSTTLTLPPDKQQLVVDLKAIDWSIDAEPVPWGQQDGAIATLRIHPIGAAGSIALSQVSVGPAGKSEAQSGQSSPQGSTPLEPIHDYSFWWSSAQVRQNLEDFRHSPLSWQGMKSVPAPARSNGWAIFAVLVGLFVWMRWRNRSALVLLVAAIWICFSQPSWQVTYLACAIAALFFCIYIQTTSARRILDAEPSNAQIVAPSDKAKKSVLTDFLLASALLAVLYLAMLLLDGQSQSWGVAPRRWLIYLVWAGLQQWVVCGVIYPLVRRYSADPMPGIVISAFIFGWAHQPNLELMLLTWLLGLACLWHYSRHQTLWAPMALHMMAGSALLIVTPLPLLYSVSAGPGFWG